jgi:tetratricopeptide (TPR) repeat protein
LAEKEEQYEEQKKAWGNPPDLQRAHLERTRHPGEAKALFSRAKRAYQEHDFWNSIQLCQQAIEIVSDEAEYYHLLGLALQENPKWRQDAERNFKIASNLDPWKTEYLLALGKLYQKAGMNLRASKMFQQANAIDPTIGEVGSE